MTVPSGHQIHRIDGSTFGTPQTQGGTILNNSTTSTDRITKSFPIVTALDASPNLNTGPSVAATGGGTGVEGAYTVHKPLSGGTFAYSAAGKYVIARVSDTLSGASQTSLVFMGRREERPIAQFEADRGAKYLTMWRENRFSWTKTLDTGLPMNNMRINWINAGGTAAAAPDTLPTSGMWAPGGATRNGTGALAKHTDVAANAYAVSGVDYDASTAGPGNTLRGIPGRLVIKSNFVSLNTWTDAKGAFGNERRPDFYLYKPITGM